MTVSGNTLYATTNQGLSIYNVGPMAETPVTVSVEVPNNTGVSIIPNSFNVPPSQTIVGTDYTTLVWTDTFAPLETAATYTWQSTVSNVVAGQSTEVTLGTAVAFTDQGVSGSLSLPPTSIVGAPIIELISPTQTVQPGGTATYDVRLSNPYDQNVSYSIGEQDDDDSNTISSTVFNVYPFGITLEPGQTIDVALSITTYSDSAAGDYTFSVLAEANYQPGPLGTVQGELVVAGAPSRSPIRTLLARWRRSRRPRPPLDKGHRRTSSFS